MGKIISYTYDLKLLESGIESFSILEKNQYFSYIADKEDILVTEITEDFMLEYHKKLKIQYLSNICEEQILTGFVSSNGHTYRTNRDDQLNFLGTYVLTKDDETVTEIMWKAEDVGEQIPHTKSEFITIVNEGFIHKQSKLFKLHTLRKQITNCVLDSEIVAIKWD